jgi:hypothetical protein
MTISHYKVYSKQPEAHFYQSFVGEPLCPRLINRVNDKLQQYFNDNNMSLNCFIKESKKQHTGCAMGYFSTHLGFFKYKNPLQQLYQLGSQVNNNTALKKLDVYLENQLQKHIPKKTPVLSFRG